MIDEGDYISPTKRNKQNLIINYYMYVHLITLFYQS